MTASPENGGGAWAPVERTQLDWNESPEQPSPKAIAAILANVSSLNRYPRGLREATTAAVAEHFGMPPEGVLLTNGVDEAADLLLSLSGSAWCAVPGFQGYRHRAEVLGRQIRPIPLDEQWQPTTDPAELRRGGVVLVAQPNNPTGGMFRRDWVEAAAGHAELLCVDETYLEFGTRPSYLPLTRRHPGLCVFRSFSKAWGLAALRIGVLLGDPALIARLADRQAFHSVGAIALHALRGALDDPDHVARQVRQVRQDRPLLVRLLTEADIFAEVRDTEANFVLARYRPAVPVGRVVAHLGQAGVDVKDCADFGLPGWLRVTVGSRRNLAALARGLASLREPVTVPAPDQTRGSR